MSEGVTYRIPGGFPGQPNQPVPPAGRRPDWDSAPLQEGMDQWRYVRRAELGNLATPFVVALLRGDDMSATAGEAWRPDDDQAQRDEEIVRRAVRIARFLQVEIDRARPRSG